MDEDKVKQCFDEILSTINKYKLSGGEIIKLYGNLGYSLGGSLGEHGTPGPTVKQLEEMYYKKPTADVALMLQGLLIMSWYEDYQSQKQNQTQ